MANKRLSLQVIMAMPAVKLRTMWWAAALILSASGSRAKSYKTRQSIRKNSRSHQRKAVTFFTICSQVVRAILIDLSRTGAIQSWTALSMEVLMYCLRLGWAWKMGRGCTMMCGTRPAGLFTWISWYENLGSGGPGGNAGVGVPADGAIAAALVAAATVAAADTICWGISSEVAVENDNFHNYTRTWKGNFPERIQVIS